MNYPFFPFPLLQTTRLELRQLTKYDAATLYKLRGLKAVNQYTYGPAYNSIKDVEQFILKIERFIAQNDSIYWTIALKSQKELIGTICFWNFSEEKSCIELGYELHPNYHRQGIMMEAFEPIIEYGFSTINARKIIALPHKENTASILLLEKCNFKKNLQAEKEIPTEELGQSIVYELVR